jgi:hypothetical protein
MKYLNTYKLFERIDIPEMVKGIIADSLIDLVDNGVKYRVRGGELEFIRNSTSESFCIVISHELFNDDDSFTQFKWSDVVGSISELVSQLSDSYDISSGTMFTYRIEQDEDGDDFIGEQRHFIIKFVDDEWMFSKVVERRSTLFKRMGDFEWKLIPDDMNINQMVLEFKKKQK